MLRNLGLLRCKDAWKKIGWAAGVGVTVGILAAFVTLRQPLRGDAMTTYVVSWHPISSTLPLDAMPLNDPQVERQEIEQLKTRNRRLEALVEVLRQRRPKHRSAQ